MKAQQEAMVLRYAAAKRGLLFSSAGSRRSTYCFRHDATRRLKFTDDDMKVIWDNLNQLSASDQLLMRVLATTGMRLGEAFQTTRESEERGIRATFRLWKGLTCISSRSKWAHPSR
jgi:integrase